MNDIILDWAIAYGVDERAALALINRLTHSTYPTNLDAGACDSEAAAQQSTRFAAANAGWLVWRNNSGVGLDENGNRTIRYGLCNDSPQLNARYKSADLIGIKPVLITPELVGTTLGQFVARECKPPGWKYRGTDREQAQQNFLMLVNARGGDGKFSIGGL
jgi:hypothetical protein